MTTKVEPRTWSDTLPQHPAGALLPKATPEERAQMLADFKQHGCLEPIEIWKALTKDGTVVHPEQHYLLVGATRADVMEELRGEPLVYDRVDGFGEAIPWKYVENVRDPFEYVISRELLRRHLSDLKRVALLGQVMKLREEAIASGDPAAFSQHLTERQERKLVHQEQAGLFSPTAKKSPHRATGKSKGRPKTPRAELVSKAKALGIGAGAVDRHLRKEGVSYNAQRTAKKPAMTTCPTCKGSGKVPAPQASDFRLPSDGKGVSSHG